jgi:predicted RNase H-like nuclease (RuvC/YqgF family)
MKLQVSQLKADIAIKESKLNDAKTKEKEKVHIHNNIFQLNQQLTQLETRLTNRDCHLNKLKEEALHPKQGNKD